MGRTQARFLVGDLDAALPLAGDLDAAFAGDLDGPFAGDLDGPFAGDLDDAFAGDLARALAAVGLRGTDCSGGCSIFLMPSTIIVVQ